MSTQQQGGSLPPKQTVTPTKVVVPANFVGPLAPNEVRATTQPQPTSQVTPLPQVYTANNPPPGYRAVTPTSQPASQVVQPKTVAPAQTPIRSNPPVTDIIATILKDPFGFMEKALPIAQVIAHKTPGALGQVAQGYVGAAGTVANQVVTVKNTIGGLIGQKQDPFSYVPKTTAEKIGGYAEQATEIAGVAVVTGGSSLAWGGVAVGAYEVLNFAPKIPIINPNPTGKFDTDPTNIMNQFLLGEVTAGVFKGAGAIAERIPVVANIGSKVSSRLVTTPVLGRVITQGGKALSYLDERIPGALDYRAPISDKAVGMVGLPTVETEPTGAPLDLSFKNVMAYEKTIRAAEIATPQDIFIGRSVEPLPKIEGIQERPYSPQTYKPLIKGQAPETTEVLAFTKQPIELKSYSYPTIENDAETKAILKAMKATPAEAPKGEYWNFEQGSTQQQILVKPAPKDPIAQSLIGESTPKAEPTGIDKVLSDFQSGRTVNTAKVETPFNYSIINPFTRARSNPYGITPQASFEEEPTYLSYPKNSPLNVPSTTINQMPDILSKQIPDISSIQTPLATPIQSQFLLQKTIQEQIQTTDQTQRQTQRQDQIGDMFTIPIGVPLLSISNTDDIFRKQFLPRKTGRSGLLSTKRLYPILTGKEVLSLDISKTSRRKRRK